MNSIKQASDAGQPNDKGQAVNVEALLNRFGYFGVHLGLERIQRLLAELGDPHQQVPIIHVAGSNGKGSVCAYLSAVLTQAGYRVGRYTSPHLVDWCERICLNEQPIAPEALEQVLRQVEAAIAPDQPSPTQFEVITAAMWLYFAQQQVEIAVVEVGLGGRLDATNVCDRPLVSVITSLSREHWQRLGPTLADIAREKAGILKAGCPAVIGPLPPEAQAVVEKRIAELNCPAVWPQPAIETQPGWAEVASIPNWFQSKAKSQKPKAKIEYSLPLPGAVQLSNSALAIAALQILQQQGWEISDAAIVNGIAKTQWPGRLHWLTWRGHRLLVDGAHNPAGAQALRQYIDRHGDQPGEVYGDRSVVWVVGMIGTKDHEEVLEALLRPNDQLHLVPVPDHEPVDLDRLADLAQQRICPQLVACETYADLELGLQAATQNAKGVGNQPTPGALVVLAGSLYLLGDFFKRFQADLGPNLGAI
ncbi:bifunctional folylpolyglutamate synthase/dihydrofolate synthase [Trichocoleus desertorum AS-A10]|uniref:bifunctional folylpolyglutamate synthase/dihydrofolate synthase n=1 Tax=Trichocoleus desertorum TaxID=1481672 RepID=UPI00329A3C07